jgi:hypothetical protein
VSSGIQGGPAQAPGGQAACDQFRSRAYEFLEFAKPRDVFAQQLRAKYALFDLDASLELINQMHATISWSVRLG